MKKIEGEIIHRSRDGFGELLVVEQGPIRSLHFGRSNRQSSILTDRPATLVLPYTQAMMAALLFKRWPASALFIGLGGGSMVKFLLQACPTCRIEAVELRARVIAIAHHYFEVPVGEPRLRIHHADARDFILRPGKHDLLFVDAFDADGPAGFVCSPGFLAACRRLLTADGLFVINLWACASPALVRDTRVIAETFGGQVLETAVGKNQGNLVLFAAVAPGVLEDTGKKYRAAAEKLATEFEIDFPAILGRIRPSGLMSWWRRLAESP